MFSLHFRIQILHAEKENVVGFCCIRRGQKHNWHLEDTVIYSDVQYYQIQATSFVCVWLQFFFQYISFACPLNLKT